VRTTYEVRLGRHAVGLLVASSAQEALFGYLRGMGSRDTEISRLGVDKASWRGAVYSVAPAAEDAGRRAETRPSPY
jgi:hypothetical protein